LGKLNKSQKSCSKSSFNTKYWSELVESRQWFFCWQTLHKKPLSLWISQ